MEHQEIVSIHQRCWCRRCCSSCCWFCRCRRRHRGGGCCSCCCCWFCRSRRCCFPLWASAPCPGNRENPQAVSSKPVAPAGVGYAKRWSNHPAETFPISWIICLRIRIKFLTTTAGTFTPKHLKHWTAMVQLICFMILHVIRRLPESFHHTSIISFRSGRGITKKVNWNVAEQMLLCNNICNCFALEKITLNNVSTPWMHLNHYHH